MTDTKWLTSDQKLTNLRVMPKPNSRIKTAKPAKTVPRGHDSPQATDTPPANEGIVAIHRWLESVLRRTAFSPKLVQYLETVGSEIGRNDAEYFEEDESAYLRACANLGELCLQFGKPQLARKVLHRGEDVFSSLPQMVSPKADLRQRRLLRNRVQYVVDSTMVTHYLDQDYAEAERLVQLCRSLTQGPSGIAVETFPCFGALSDIFYYLGLINTRLGQYELSANYFRQSLQFNTEKVADLRGSLSASSDGSDPIFNSARHRIALCLLGFARLEYERGALDRALWFVHPARALLAHSTDALNRAHVDLLYAATLRSKAGDHDPDDKDPRRRAELQEAISALQKSCDTFNSFEHKDAGLNATFDLALAYVCAKRFDEAEALFSELASHGHPLVNCYVLARRSRIARSLGNRSRAVSLADEALSLARSDESKRHNMVLAEIDAQIAMAEALLMEPATGAEARQSLEEALRLSNAGTVSQRSPRTEVICLLLYAESWAKDLDTFQAEEWLRKAEILLPNIENNNVHRLARIVRTSVEAAKVTGDLVIRAFSTQSLRYEEHVRELQRYLLSLARQKCDSKREVARALGVSPTTVSTWEQDLLQARQGRR